MIDGLTVLALTHQWDHLLTLDTRGQDIGEDPLHTIARLEAELPLIHDQGQQEAVVPRLRA